jgi:thiamine-phosphate pyrophosphorylase
VEIAAMRWDMSIAQLLTLLTRFKSHKASHIQIMRLPRLLILSDEARGYGLEVQIARWPTGGAFIERTYGQEPHLKRGRNIIQLASCTPRQARSAKLDGLHWPEKALKHRHVSASHSLIETTSAHSGLAIAKASRAGFDAVLVSTAFASDSPSASRPLGPIRLARLQRTFPTAKIYALGGISLRTAKRLSRTGIYGVALVSFRKI